jgi:hypothetical protein
LNFLKLSKGCYLQKYVLPWPQSSTEVCSGTAFGMCLCADASRAPSSSPALASEAEPAPTAHAASTDANKPKIDPETEAAFVRYASSCACGRQRDDEDQPRSVCWKLMQELCSRKNVKCDIVRPTRFDDGLIARFTDDAGKVIGMGSGCARRINEP